jgi:hypothetical protein
MISVRTNGQSSIGIPAGDVTIESSWTKEQSRLASVGHHEPALPTVIGEATGRQQVSSDQDGHTGRDDGNASGGDVRVHTLGPLKTRGISITDDCKTPVLRL